MALTQISTKGLKDGTILNADISASAAIAGTKISPSFTSDIILTNANPSISLLDSDANSDFKINVNGGIFSIKDQTNVDATRLAIDSSGNLGINTLSPNQLLEVANSSGGATISISTDEQAGSQASKKYNNLDFTGFNNTVMARIQSWDESSSTGHGYLTFFTNKNGVGFTEKLRIDPDGNVGIGTVSPGNLLNLSRSSTTAYSASLTTNDSTLMVQNTGAAGHATIEMQVKSSGTTQTGKATISATPEAASSRATSLTFGTRHQSSAMEERMRITSTGTVGIGTSVPSELFTINGADQSALIRTSNAVGTAKLKFEADGANYAGIGLENTSLVFRCSNSSTPTSRMTIAADGAVTISGSISNAAMTHITDSGSATTLGTAATCRISNNGGNGAFSVFEAESNVGSIRLANDGQFYVTGASTFSNDIRVDRGTAGVDGLLGQAYSGYFGLKHADQTINAEYMILNNNTSTFISCSSGYNIYIRPSANSQVHETIFAHNTTTFNTNLLISEHNIQRSQHHTGHLEGGYVNIGGSETKTNTIFTIGSNYNPNESTLSNMYGVGYSKGDASFLPTGSNWGFYAAANGISRIFLDTGSGQGRIYFGGNLASEDRFISHVTGDYGSMQISNGAKNGWSGYSIDGHSVFMSNGSAVGDYFGLYDDNASQWALLYARQAWVRLYYGGGLKLETTNAGVTISGTISATNLKSFRISHPLSKLSETKDLVHAAIEGPQMDLMYRGKVDLVNGTATVNIDTKSGMTEGTFDVLNRDVQCFTTNETGWTNVKGSVTGNKLTIVAENNSCTDTISWIVIGERKDNDVISSEVTDDNGDLIVEPDKQVTDDEPKMDS